MTTTTAMTAVNPFTHANPMANGTSTGKDSGTAATISANDFLTLLVTEMKNQDPTAQTDPNAYVNQLVQVNSLEQLIQINENLSSAVGTTGDPVGAQARVAMGSATDASVIRSPRGISKPIAVPVSPVPVFGGNLGIAKTNPAAQRIAQALSGH